MFTAKIGIPAQEHDAFVKNSKQTNLLQSSNWAKIKDNWGNERIGIYRKDQLVAAASVLIQPLPAGFTLLYIPRGPIMDYQNKDLVAFMLQTLKAFGKTKKALFIKFDPSLFLRQGRDLGEMAEQASTLTAIQTLQDLGCEWTGRTSDIAENIQPRFQANLYADQFDLANLSKRTKQEIRTATNKGVEITFGGKELVEEFAALMKKTESRKGIHLRGQDYYEKLLETYGEDAYLTMGHLDLAQKEAETQEQLAKVKDTMATFTDNTRANKVKEAQTALDRLTKDLAFIQGKRALDKDKVALAATLTLNYGDTSENIYAGMDEDYRAYQAPTLVWYQTAVEGFRRGVTWQNMGGIENQMDGGLFRFKSKFEPVIEEFAGEFNLPVSPLLYKLANLAYKLRKQLRSKR